MRQFNFLTRLLDAPSGEFPFISLYLNTEPNETGKKDFEVFLRKQLNDHAAVMEPGTKKLENFQNDGAKVEEFADSLEASTRGAAIFANTGSGDFFEAFEFSVPFDQDRFYLFNRPYIFPLVRLMDQNPTFAVVAADTNSAHIYVFKRAETIRHENIENVKTNRTEVGGWSQMRYQRHIENFHQQHAKEVINELDKIVRTDRIERVVLAGDQAVIIPLLREEMSNELAGKIVDTLSLNVHTPEHELADAARDAVARYDAEADKKSIDHLIEVNYEDGVGVTGFTETLAALLNGQVQELYLSADADDIVYRNEDVKVLLKDYSPGLDEELPATAAKELMIDELIRRAVQSADRIRFVEDSHPLKTAGGVGALLRYQTKGASNS